MMGLILIAISAIALAALIVYTVMVFRECREIARLVQESQARTDEKMARTARLMAETEQKMRELGLRPR